MGMQAFADRAATALRRMGETVGKPTQAPVGDLTPQEEQIRQLVGDGLSNTQVAAALLLSPRTVEWHLGHIYAKLGITSRRQLQR
jgi:DNA-binding NarL/FixJ family response regulator